MTYTIKRLEELFQRQIDNSFIKKFKILSFLKDNSF